MWLRYYIKDKVGVRIIDSIPHCFSKHFSMAVWNTIDDTYSKFVLYIVTKPHFLILPLFKAYSLWQCEILSMIDTPILVLCRNEVTYFYFAILESIFSRTVWNTLDDRFSNFVLSLYRDEATFLDFRLF